MNKINIYTLDNGIPVYICSDPSLKQVYMKYIIKYGSDGKWFNFNLNGKDIHVPTGCAHYLEHILLEHSPYGYLPELFGKRKYYTNAETAMNYTGYYFCGVDNVMDSIKKLIISIESPVFNKKDVDKARYPILEESSELCDNYNDCLYNLLVRNMYGSFEKIDSTLSVIGNRETTKSITIDDLYNCYNAFYDDNSNKAIILVGNINSNMYIEFLNNIYKYIIKPQNKILLPNYDFAPIRESGSIIYRDSEQELNGLGIKIKKTSDMDSIDLEYCTNFIDYFLLNKGDAFSKKLKEKGIINNTPTTYLTTDGDYSEYTHILDTNNMDEYSKRLIDTLKNIKITPENFESFRKIYLANLIKSTDYKYYFVDCFTDSIGYSDTYDDGEYIRNIDYDSFKSKLESLDFDTYVTAKIKKLK